MYPNEQSYVPNDSVNIEKHITTYLLNARIFNVNSGNKGSPIIVIAYGVMYATRNTIRYRVKICFFYDSFSLVKQNLYSYNSVGHRFFNF
jgi:hypothetical protein